LKHAFSEKKPVLAICYGCQLLNVYLGGTLIQDLREETDTPIAHAKHDIVPEPEADPVHAATFEEASRIAKIAGTVEAPVNSSHHQAVERVGKGLQVTAHAPDGTIEAVEWTGDSNWVVGVQWHPERMFGDAFSERLFRDFIAAASQARSAVEQKV
jgi:putative glutamine amidotransferase